MRRYLRPLTLIVLSGALALSACSTGPDEQAATPEVTAESSSQTLSDPDDEGLEETPTPTPLGYEDILGSSSITTAEICDSYQVLLTKYDEVSSKRIARLTDVEDDPYKAASFVNKSDWVTENLSDKVESEFSALATEALNSQSNGKAGTLDSINPYLEASIASCGYTSQLSAIRSASKEVDQEANRIVSAAANKPWYPRGFEEYTDGLAYRWIDGAGVDCYSRCWYWTMEVVAESGCPSGLYGELTIEKNGTAIDWTNDSLPGLRPGQKGRLQFVTYADAAYGGTGSLAELNCY